MNMPIMKNQGTAVEPDSTATGTLYSAPEYLATLRVTGDTTIGDGSGYFVISTSLDETFALSMGSQWDAPFANVMSDAANNMQQGGGKTGAAIGAARLTGTALGIPERTRVSSAQVWQTSDPMTFSIPFTFVAIKDPVVEVRNKVRDLLKLTAPSDYGPMLRAPGPSLVDQFGGRHVSLHIGNFLLLDNCIIERVDAQFDSIFGQAGIPLKAKVNVSVTSFFTCFTTTDIDHMFNRTSR